MARVEIGYKSCHHRFYIYSDECTKLTVKTSQIERLEFELSIHAPSLQLQN
jgi:hypothetical protein